MKKRLYDAVKYNIEENCKEESPLYIEKLTFSHFILRPDLIHYKIIRVISMKFM